MKKGVTIDAFLLETFDNTSYDILINKRQKQTQQETIIELVQNWLNNQTLKEVIKGLLLKRLIEQFSTGFVVGPAVFSVFLSEYLSCFVEKLLCEKGKYEKNQCGQVQNNNPQQKSSYT